MDISLLKTFLELARTRHFGKAADALFVTQSAVSARIKLLESNLAVELFSRRRNDIQLTPAGIRLIQHAETIVRGWERARHEIALDGQGTETLAVGCPFDLWGIILLDWAAALRRQSPRLVLHIEVQPSDILVGRLVSGLLDLALFFEPPLMPDLTTKQVADVPLVLVSGREGCNADEAVSRDYYMVDWGSVFSLSHAEYFPDIPPPAARLASGTLARDLILSTGGSAYLAEQMVRQELKEGVLFTVADAPVIERNAFAVYRPADEKRRELKQTLALLREVGNGPRS